MITLIAILSEQTRAIGRDGALIWRNRADMQHFKELTSGHPVIMGRKTWESLPERFRPLPGRTNIVVSRDPGYAAPGAVVAASIEAALSAGRAAPGGEELWVMGGGAIYALALPYADRLSLTLVDDPAEGDAVFPHYSGFTSIKESAPATDDAGHQYRFVTLARA